VAAAAVLPFVTTAAMLAADVVTLVTMAVAEGSAAATAAAAVVTLVPMTVAGPHSGEGGPDPDHRGPRPPAWTVTQPAGLERVGRSGGAQDRDITAAARSPWLEHDERCATAEGGGPPWGPPASAPSALSRSTSLLSQGDGVPLAGARSPDSHASARSRSAASRRRANRGRACAGTAAPAPADTPDGDAAAAAAARPHRPTAAPAAVPSSRDVGRAASPPPLSPQPPPPYATRACTTSAAGAPSAAEPAGPPAAPSGETHEHRLGVEHGRSTAAATVADWHRGWHPPPPSPRRGGRGDGGPPPPWHGGREVPFLALWPLSPGRGGGGASPHDRGASVAGAQSPASGGARGGGGGGGGTPRAARPAPAAAPDATAAGRTAGGPPPPSPRLPRRGERPAARRHRPPAYRPPGALSRRRAASTVLADSRCCLHSRPLPRRLRRRAAVASGPTRPCHRHEREAVS